MNIVSQNFFHKAIDIDYLDRSFLSTFHIILVLGPLAYHQCPEIASSHMLELI